MKQTQSRILFLAIALAISMVGCAPASEQGTDKSGAQPGDVQAIKSEATKGSDMTAAQKTKVEANVEANTAQIKKNGQAARGELSDADKQAAIEHYKQLQSGK